MAFLKVAVCLFAIAVLVHWNLAEARARVGVTVLTSNMPEERQETIKTIVKGIFGYVPVTLRKKALRVALTIRFPDYGNKVTISSSKYSRTPQSQLLDYIVMEVTERTGKRSKVQVVQYEATDD